MKTMSDQKIKIEKWLTQLAVIRNGLLLEIEAVPFDQLAAKFSINDIDTLVYDMHQYNETLISTEK